MMWLIGILRTLFIALDIVVFWAIEKVYGLFSSIAETGVFSPEVISTFAGRIYVLLGIFMLFKVSFSLISYILNPDSFSDKNKGMGNLIKRVIVALIGVIAVPYVFQAAYSLQTIILKDNIIGNIILGAEASNITPEDGDYIKQGGKIMSHTVFTSFIRLNPDIFGENCSDNPVVKSGGEYTLNPSCDDEALQLDIKGKNGNSLTVEELMIESYSERDAGLLLDNDVISLKAEDNSGDLIWVFDYSIVFSTLTGGLLVWILLIFCIDIGVRSVKLGFLQLIAPIPLISYVDPKGEKIFQKWLGECGKTYLDLFVRLIAIYFVVYVIVIIETTSTYSLVTGEKQTDVFVNLFIILGALMFAKQLPDLISNILGVKFAGGFTLNPMKKLGQSPYAAGAVGLVGGAVGGMFANTWALGNKMYQGGKNAGPGFVNKFKGAAASLTDGFGGKRGVGHVAQNLFTGVSGGVSAGIRGAKFGLTAGGKGSALDAVSKGVSGSNQARYNRDIYAGNPKVDGSKYSWMQRRKDDIDKFAGVKNKDAGVGMYDKEMKSLKRKMEDYQGQEHALRDAMANFIATSNFSFKDFDTNSLYVGGKRNVDSNGNYNYVSWADYSASGGPITDQLTFDKFKSFQEGIDYYDSEYEKLRKQYGQYEDAFKTRNKDNKK